MTKDSTITQSNDITVKLNPIIAARIKEYFGSRASDIFILPGGPYNYPVEDKFFNHFTICMSPEPIVNLESWSTATFRFRNSCDAVLFKLCFG